MFGLRRSSSSTSSGLSIAFIFLVISFCFTVGVEKIYCLPPMVFLLPNLKTKDDSLYFGS